VIDAHWALPGGLVGAIASRATGVPLRLVLHSGGVHALSRLPYAARWARLLAAQATQITAVSRPLADRFVRLAALSQSLESCPMGITPSELMTTPAPGTVGFRGRLVPVKGADLLVDACTSLGASLLVAGEGPEKTSLEERALGLGCRATFLGSTAETPSAEVVAFPSRLLPSGRSEGLPVSLLEAMSAGAAVVVADVGGVRDVLRHGQNGLLVPPNDSGALAAAIGSLLGSASARARLGAQARSDSAALHWAHIGPKHRELLWTAANA
jgi:glycosyltransferase involved in cell wall biosynthesis